MRQNIHVIPFHSSWSSYIFFDLFDKLQLISAGVRRGASACDSDEHFSIKIDALTGSISLQ